MVATVARGRWGSSQTARIYINEALQDAEELRTSKRTSCSSRLRQNWKRSSLELGSGEWLGGEKPQDFYYNLGGGFPLLRHYA